MSQHIKTQITMTLVMPQSVIIIIKVLKRLVINSQRFYLKLNLFRF